MNNKLGINLKVARIKKQLTQEELARKLLGDKASAKEIRNWTIYIGRYENGKAEPKLETISKLIRILEMSMVDLLG